MTSILCVRKALSSSTTDDIEITWMSFSSIDQAGNQTPERRWKPRDFFYLRQLLWLKNWLIPTLLQKSPKNTPDWLIFIFVLLLEIHICHVNIKDVSPRMNIAFSCITRKVPRELQKRTRWSYMKLGQVAAPYILIYVCLLSRLNRQASVQKQREKYSIFMVFLLFL